MRTFAEELRAAMEARGTVPYQLGPVCGVSTGAIYSWLRDTRRPSLQAATKAAEYLGSPQLVRMATKGRTRRCTICRRQYVSLAKNPRHGRYCGPKCQQTAFARKGREQKESIAFARLRTAQAAIAAFCGACEPADRICRDNGCPLRSVSPLPFIPRHKEKAA